VTTVWAAVIQRNEKGWMTQERTVEQLREVWNTRPGVLHSTWMLESLNRESEHPTSDTKITPGGMTSQLQVFDVAVKPFQHDYIMCTGYCSSTPAGRPSEALLGSGLILLGVIYQQNPLSVCWKRKWCVSNSMSGTEYEPCERKVTKRRQLLF
jgi:hypothetical protein